MPPISWSATIFCPRRPGLALTAAAILGLSACHRDAPESEAVQTTASSRHADEATDASMGSKRASGDEHRDAADEDAVPRVVTASQLAWTRAAIQRNPQVELLASDPESGLFTLLDRITGEVLVVGPDELAAAPLSQLSRADDIAGSSRSSDSRDAAGAPSSEAPHRPAHEATATARNGADKVPYAIEREGGRVRVTGPGVSIVSSGQGAADAGSSAQAAAEPIICEGRRMLHLDNRDIHVEGDAITARGGCELYITNSRIVASRTGIVVHDATVHVSNSHVQGADAAFQADDRARMYVRSSTFQGVPRRTQMAQIQDQGGNRWR